MKAQTRGACRSHLTPTGWAMPFGFAAILLVFVLGLAPEASAEDISRYAFPFLSNSLEQAKVLANAFGTQMLLFTSAIGAGMPAFTYLAAFATMMGALVLVFMRQFKPSVVFPWLLCVGLVLFVPLNSRLLFTPINIQQQNTQFLMETQLGVVDAGALKNLPVLSRFTHNGESCATNPDGCGFTPQLVAVHLASTFQLIFSDLFRSTEWSGLLERADADNRLRSEVAFNLGDTWLREAEHFRNTCNTTDVLGDYVSRRLTPTRIDEINANTAPMTFGQYWDFIRIAYASSLDNSRKPPIAVLPETLEDAQKYGWKDIETFSKYYLALAVLYKNYEGEDIVVAFDTAPSGQGVNGKTVEEVLDYLSGKGFFATTVDEKNLIGRDAVWDPADNNDLPEDADLTANIGFFLNRYSEVSVDGNKPALRRACFRDTFDVIGRLNSNFLTSPDAAQENIKSACARNGGGYPEHYMKTFNLVDKISLDGFDKLEKVSEETMLANKTWNPLLQPSLQNIIMSMPVIFGVAGEQSFDPTRGNDSLNSNAPAFSFAANTNNFDTCRLAGRDLLRTVIHQLDFVGNDRGGNQPDNLFSPLIGLLDANDLGRPDGGGGDGVIPNRLAIDDIIDAAGAGFESVDGLKIKDQARYKLSMMLLDDLNETLRRVQGRGDMIKRAALVYRMLELAQSVTLQQNPNAITSAMTAANEDGSTPRVVGWTAFTNFYGELGSTITEEFMQWYVLFVGPISYMTIHFLTIMIDLALYALIALTPFLLLIGIMAPKRSMGILVITVLPVFVLKFVPVTLILLNNIAGMVYDLLPGAMGGRGEVAQAMLIMGVASMYTALIGLTMFMLFKFGDAGAFMGSMTYLDKAAKDAADTAGTIMKALSTAALAVAVGGPAALIGGMNWKKTWLGKKMIGGPDGGPAPKDKTPTTRTGHQIPERDAAVTEGNYTPNAFDDGLLLNGQNGVNPLRQLDMLRDEGKISESDYNQLSQFVSNRNPSEGAMSGDIMLENGQMIRADSLWNGDNQEVFFKAVQGPQPGGEFEVPKAATQTLIPDGAGIAKDSVFSKISYDDAKNGNFEVAPDDQASNDKVKTPDVLSTGDNQAVEQSSKLATGTPTDAPAEAQTATRVVGAGDATGAAGAGQTSTPLAQIQADKVELTNAGGAASGKDAATTDGNMPPVPEAVGAEDDQSTVGRVAGQAAAEDTQDQKGTAQPDATAKKPDDSGPDISDKTATTVKDKLEAYIQKQREATEAEMEAMLKAAGVQDKAALKAKNEKDYNKYVKFEEAVADLNKISATAGEMGETFKKGEQTDALLNKHNKGFGADRDFTTSKDAMKLLMSGFVGGARGLAKGAGGIPILGDLIGEVLNESMEGRERLKAWESAGGMMAYRRNFYDAQRMKMYQANMAPLAAGNQYQQMEATSSFQSMATSAKNDAAFQVSKMRSDLEAIVSKRFGEGKLNIENIDVRQLDYAADEIAGLGRVAAAQKYATVFAEAGLMQDESMIVKVWNDEKGKLEDKKFKPNVATLGDVYGDLAGKTGNKYFDEAMVGWYGIKEKHGRTDPAYDGTARMAHDRKALAKFGAADVDTDYLVGGHNKMVEGKIQFYEARGKHAEYLTLRNEEAFKQYVQTKKMVQSGDAQDFINTLYAGPKVKDGKIGGVTKEAALQAMSLVAKDKNAIKNLGTDFAKVFKGAIVEKMGGALTQPLGGMAEEAFQRGQYAVRTKSKIAQYNIDSMEDDLTAAIVKAQTDAFESGGLNKLAQRQRLVRYDQRELHVEKADQGFLKFLRANYSEDQVGQVMKAYATLSKEDQKDAIQSVLKDVVDDNLGIDGKELINSISDKFAKAIASQNVNISLGNNNSFATASILKKRKTGEVTEKEELHQIK